MYVPKHFDAPDQAWCHALIERESFALLVSTGGDGAPFATHLPLLLDRDRGSQGTSCSPRARPLSPCSGVRTPMSRRVGTVYTRACPRGTTWRCTPMGVPWSSRSRRG
jgi:Putative FMN-binding domain